MAVKAKVDSYSVEIERLNKSIPLSREPERQRMMQRHSELCKQHKRLCSLKNRMGGINSEYHRKLDDQNKEDAHKDIDHIFKDLLPLQGMPERPEQIALSHRMLEAMQDGGIALCDAGTGIGKTYAYLVAGILFHGLRPSRPVLISTSSIALQRAVRDEYLPLLSTVLTEDFDIVFFNFKIVIQSLTE